MEIKKYSAFTLVEMLIVMGILIILMAVGITAGRFAINRANDVAHQNAADQIYTAMQAYYTDNREFPILIDFGDPMDQDCNPDSPAGTICINEYMGEGEFTGGTDATFYYYAEPERQQDMMICVSKGGWGDDQNRGFYCTGNSFGSQGTGPGSITDKEVENDTTLDHESPGGVTGWTLMQNWNADDKSWAAFSL